METVGDIVSREGQFVIVLLSKTGDPIEVPLCEENMRAIVQSLAHTIRYVYHVFRDFKDIKPKKQRRKTLYNMFISQRLTEMAHNHPQLSRKERMQTAVTEYKLKKGTLKMSNPILSVTNMDTSFFDDEDAHSTGSFEEKPGKKLIF